jgi:hypothetical protein
LGRGDQWSLFINLPVLEAATAGLSNCNLFGGGGFGPMYKASSNCSSPPLPLSCALRLTSEHLVVQGVLESGPEIALKKLSLELRQGTREFLNGSTANPQSCFPPRLLRLRRGRGRTQDARLPIQAYVLKGTALSASSCYFLPLSQ